MCTDGKRKCSTSTTHNIGILNMRSVNQGKLETIIQEIEHLNVIMLGLWKLAWDGMDILN